MFPNTDAIFFNSLCPGAKSILAGNSNKLEMIPTEFLVKFYQMWVPNDASLPYHQCKATFASYPQSARCTIVGQLNLAAHSLRSRGQENFYKYSKSTSKGGPGLREP